VRGERRGRSEERRPSGHGTGRALPGAMRIARAMVMLGIGALAGPGADGAEDEPRSVRGGSQLGVLVERRQDGCLEEVEGEEESPGPTDHGQSLLGPGAGVKRSGREGGGSIGSAALPSEMGPPHRAVAPGIRAIHRTVRPLPRTEESARRHGAWSVRARHQEGVGKA